MPRATSVPSGTDDAYRVAAIETPYRAGYARGKQALAAHQRSNRAIIDGDRARRLQGAGDPLLARRHRRRGRYEPSAACAILDALQRMLTGALGNAQMTARRPRRFWPPQSWCACRPDPMSLPVPPAIASMAGVISSTRAMKCASGSSLGSAVYKPSISDSRTRQSAPTICATRAARRSLSP